MKPDDPTNDESRLWLAGQALANPALTGDWIGEDGIPPLVDRLFKIADALLVGQIVRPEPPADTVGGDLR